MKGQRQARGISRARSMRHKRKGGMAAAADGFDRSHPQTLACLGDAWLEHMLERNYSPRSVEGDRWCLRAFLHWTQERDLNRADQITKPILETYQRWLYRCQTVRNQLLSVTTQRRYLNTVQKFFAWLCRNNTIAANPACDLELPRKKHQLLPRTLSQDEVWLLLAQPDISDPLGVRDRTILELLYSTGLRRMELVRLDVDDIEAERGVLLVRQGKGAKDRFVPVGERAMAWVERYRNQVRPQLEISSRIRALFLTGYGDRFSSGYLGNWLRRLLTHIGVTKEGSCHLLRHSCATHMLENGADIRYIQQLLGHTSLETTQIYTQVDIGQLRDVHARTHPGARLENVTEKASSSL